MLTKRKEKRLEDKLQKAKKDSKRVKAFEMLTKRKEKRLEDKFQKAKKDSKR
jgi:hypothetical protein